MYYRSKGFFNFGRVQRKARSGIGTLLQNEIVTALSDPKAAQSVLDELEKVFLGATTRMYEAAYGEVPEIENKNLGFEGNYAEFNAMQFGKQLDAAYALIAVDETRQQGLAQLNKLITEQGTVLTANTGLVVELADNTFMLNDSGMTFLSTLRSLTEESAKAGQGIIGLEEASANLRQTIDNLLPKPSMFSNFVSGFAAVVNEIKEGGLDDYSLQVEGQEDPYTGRKAALHVLTEQLGLEKKVAEQVLAQADILSNIFEKTDELIRKEKQYLSLLDSQKKRVMFFNTALTRRTSKEIELQKVTAQRTRALGEFKSFEELFSKFNDEKSKQMKDQLGQQLAQVEALDAQADILEAQLNIAKELGQTLINAFDSAGNTAIKDLLLGEKDSDDIKLKLVKDIQSASAGFLSTKVMELGQSAIMQIPGMDKLAEKMGVGGMSKEAQEFQTVHRGHIDGMASVLDQHVKGVAAATGSDAKVGVTSPTTGGSDDSSATGVKAVQKVISGGETTGSDEYTGGTGLSALFGRFGSMFDTFGGNLMGLLKGDGTGLFGKGSGGANSLFGDLFADIFGKTGLFGGLGGLGSGLMSIFGLEKGGIIGLAKGGMMPRYAHGGIATQPTYLVGEGKQNEAVVPLPDNKSIPVDLGKNTGNQNNTNITVNMADGSSEMTTDGGAELAKAIDAAVQNTLEKELRPGGILGA